MVLPYQRLNVCGNVLFCAQGGNIHAFHLESQAYLATWSHPDVVKESVLKTDSQQEEEEKPHATGQDSSAAASGEEEEVRPSKRVKLDPGNSADDTTATTSPAPEMEQTVRSSEGNGRARQKKGSRIAAPLPADLPWVSILVSSTDGQHVVAVTGHDKTIWTFHHDGSGRLEELSRRPMPKRPCALAITPDKQTIISGDKFGDVFALPLVETEASIDVPTLVSRSEKRKAAYKPEADETTVHSMRNLRALANQKMHLEQQKKENEEEGEGSSGPSFEHSLLLGHVSMLTSLVLGTHPSPSDGSVMRPYIITADRDEHIRVSRGIPQSHVIENFCLSHENFVSDLCIPTAKPEKLLISGGGDPELLVWDWASGKMLSRHNLLQHVQAVDATKSNLAVSRMVSYEYQKGDMQTHHMVAVICERVPALFLYEVDDNDGLSYVQTVSLPANSLDVGIKDGNVIVSLDLTSPSSESLNGEAKPAAAGILVVCADEDGHWKAKDASLVLPGGIPALDLTAENLHKALYTIESLRKAEMEGRRDE